MVLAHVGKLIPKSRATFITKNHDRDEGLRTNVM